MLHVINSSAETVSINSPTPSSEPSPELAIWSKILNNLFNDSSTNPGFSGNFGETRIRPIGDQM